MTTEKMTSMPSVEMLRVLTAAAAKANQALERETARVAEAVAQVGRALREPR